MCGRTEKTNKFQVLKCNMENDFDVLIKKRKSRNSILREKLSLTCQPKMIFPATLSAPTKTMDGNSCASKKCKIKTNQRCKNPNFYFIQTILLSWILQVLLFTHNTDCMKIDKHRHSIKSEHSGYSDNDTYSLNSSNSLNIDSSKNNHISNNVTIINVLAKSGLQSHRHRRHQHQRSHDPNVQSIQPKICHSLASSNSYLSSAFAHNFPLSSPSSSSRSLPSYNELSIENKLVLSPIVFQGKPIRFNYFSNFIVKAIKMIRKIKHMYDNL